MAHASSGVVATVLSLTMVTVLCWCCGLACVIQSGARVCTNKDVLAILPLCGNAEKLGSKRGFVWQQGSNKRDCVPANSAQ